MANEITDNTRLQLAYGSWDKDFNPGRIRVTYTPLVVYDKTSLITTGEVTITHGVTNPRFCILYNLDATNYVEAGTTTTDYPMYLRPASIPTKFEIGPAKASIYLKANTASCYVQVIVF